VEELDEAQDAWKRIPRERRESLLLHVLGDERLILRELTSRLNAELGSPDRTDAVGRTVPGWSPIAVYEGNVRNLVRRMNRAGQLDRAVAERQRPDTMRGRTAPAQRILPQARS
jgi:hypothetical protein